MKSEMKDLIEQCCKDILTHELEGMKTDIVKAIDNLKTDVVNAFDSRKPRS